MFYRLKRIISTVFVSLLLAVQVVCFAPSPALAATPLDFISVDQIVHALSPKHLKQLEHLLANKQLIRDAKRFLNTTPDTFCAAYFDMLGGSDSTAWAVIEEGVTSAATVTQAISSASVAGAGSLSGYAGIASAVSQLGLGGVTTTIAGMMGSSATGAAATAVVTSAVGGPMVMGALLVGGTGATVYGTYKAGAFAVDKLGDWADFYCQSR